MSAFSGLLKFWAYVFHLTLSAFFLGVGILARTGHQSLQLEMLPFDQGRLISRVSLMGIFGFIAIFLALVRIFEFVFPLWSIAIIVLFVWGFFFTPYMFNGTRGLEQALLLILAAIFALIGSFFVLMPKPRHNRW